VLPPIRVRYLSGFRPELEKLYKSGEKLDKVFISWSTLVSKDSTKLTEDGADKVNKASVSLFQTIKDRDGSNNKKCGSTMDPDPPPRSPVAQIKQNH
jgi:hypothetical protein